MIGLEIAILAIDVFMLLILLRGIMLVSRARAIAEQMTNEIIEKKIKEAWEQRDKFKQPIMQFVQEMAKDMQGPGRSGQGPTGIMAGGMEFPLSFLPKKYQGIAQLAMMFLGKQMPGQPGQSSNPKNPWE